MFSKKSIRGTNKHHIEDVPFILTVKNGWITKVYKDGSSEQISRVENHIGFPNDDI
jgi:hypothetical protein